MPPVYAFTRLPRRGQGRRTTTCRLLVCLACALSAATATAQSSSAPAAAPRASVAVVVAGIISYTRWPADVAAIRLCTVGRGPGIDELLLRAAEIGSVQRPVVVRPAVNAAEAGSECDAVYVAGVDAAAGRQLLRSMAGQPVLMLGEGAEFCSDGGMFCLEPAAVSIRFNANLDAIARSGLRVNPLVLRIARSAIGGGS
ncbi:YfiR family protein [uncultured Piscinibacter sp.]|uniref:YfiR family protein n=1 Tax=uncultured Piscinibacter sp. TaxID=1131835 RepID=UPI002603F0CD|nr:YfiR family protein [uncultured Piscinibacter sp.]